MKPTAVNHTSAERTAKTDIWMPLFIGDYLADTAHLDAERSGCYLHWLMHYWRKGPLPSEIPGLIQIGKLCSKNAASIVQALLEDFFQLQDDGRYHQGRIDEELRISRGKKLKAIEKASKAGRSRWQKDASSNATSSALSNTTCIKQAMLESCPSPSPSEEKQKTLAPSGASSIRPEEFSEAWNRLCGPLSKVSALTDGRRRKVKVRITQGLTLERFSEVVRKCASTPFLTGDNKSGWRVDFDFLIENATNIAKVMEGRYDDKRQGATIHDVPRPPSRDEFIERQHEEELEERQSYEVWKSMSANYREANPWTGKRFDEAVEPATENVA